MTTDPIDAPAAADGSRDGAFSAEEWATRVDLAACYRLVDMFGMSDLIANHISAAVPGESGHFLINPYGMLYEEITASSLLKVDFDGQIIGDAPDGYGINRAGFVIHSAVHRARPEMHCVIHTHSAAGMAVSSLECGLLPMTQTAMRFAHCGYHDYEGVVLDLGEQERLIADLADHDLLILRNHGLLVVGQTIPQAFNQIHRAELACRSQLMAMACGTPLIEPAGDVIDATYVNYKPDTRQPFGVLDWPALLRKVDKVDRSYRS